MPPLVNISQLTKRFGVVTAVWKVDLEISSGDFVVIFGPNGAGKSTLLQMVAKLVQPSSGEIDFIGSESNQPAGRVGYVSHLSLLYNELTGLENLVFFAKLYGVSAPLERAEELLEKMSLTRARDQFVRGYSRGMKQRLTIARALIHNPELLLLDEPYAGLDQHGSRLLTEVLSQLKEEGRTILMITHSLSEGLALSTRVLVMNSGQVVHNTPRSEVDDSRFESLYFRLVEN